MLTIVNIFTVFLDEGISVFHKSINEREEGAIWKMNANCVYFKYLNRMKILPKSHSPIKMWYAVMPHRFIRTEVIFIGDFY